MPAKTDPGADDRNKALALDALRRTGLTRRQLAGFLGIEAGTLDGLLATPGRRLPASAMVLVVHLLGAETVDARLARIRAE